MRHASSLIRNGLLAGLVLALAVAAPAVAAPVVVDEFVAVPGPTSWVIDLVDPDPTAVTTAHGSILGGERELAIDVVGPAGLVSASGTVDDGTLLHGSFGSSPATLSLLYDGPGAGSLGPIDLSGLSKFVLDFLFIDTDAAPSVDLLIELSSPGGGAAYAGPLLPSAGPVTETVPFSAFLAFGGFSFAAIDSIKISFNGVSLVPNADFQLDRVSIVPEPASWVLGALGLAGLFIIRRRRS